MAQARFLQCAAVGAALIAATPAWGQAAAPTPPPADTPEPAADQATTDETGGVGDIVVTARRRSESVQKVPISITAVTGETLQRRGLADVKSLTNFTPNLEVNNGRPDGGGSTAQIFIRGVGQNDFLIPNDPGVGLYVDDVYVARSTGAITGLSDVQTIEVLRGPQGTLYGKNTIGGAVRITSKQPEFSDFSGRLAVTAGSYGRLDFTGGVNLPLADNLAIRIAGSSRNTNDIGKRVLDPTGRGTGNINQDAARLILRWEPAPRLSLSLTADYTKTRQHGPFGANIRYIPGGSVLIDVLNAQIYPRINASLGLPAGSRFDSRYVSSPEVDFGTGPNQDDNDVWGVSGVLAYKLTDDITVKSITAFRRVKAIAGRDGDHSPYAVSETINTDNNRQFSQEFQLNGASFGDRLKWTLGLYYLRENLRNSIRTKLWDGLFQSTLGIDFNALSSERLIGTSKAAFGQATLDLTDRLHVTAGGRYNNEKKDFNNRWYFLQQPREFTCPGLDVNGRFENCKSEDNVFTPMASVAYDVASTVMLYGSYSEGFKAGGWTPRLFSQQSLKRFRPERLKAFEAGFKSSWLNRRLVFNADVFVSNYQDLQLTSVLADSQGNPQPVVENAGEARIWGIEAEGSARITDTTTLQFGLGYIDARYTRLDPGVSFGLDNKLPDTPPLTLNGAIDQVVPLRGGGDVTLRVDASYKGRTYKDPGNNPFIAQRPFTMVNSRISYNAPGGRWTLAGFVTNLLDKRYITNALDLTTTFGYLEAYFGRPREFGAELSVKF